MSGDDRPSDQEPTLPPEAWIDDPTEAVEVDAFAPTGPPPLPDQGEPIPLTAFDLQRIVGRGGEGEVWLGTHREQQSPVAVKVMKARYAQDEQYRTRFNGEARAAAALNHRGIVSILDYGTIGEGAAQRSDGRLVAGCPYLVMDFAEGGPLRKILPFREFSELRGVLTAILDALAHAHARGVIHRDIKPGNILVRQRDRQNPGILIADFGIAFASHTDTSPDTARIQSRLRLWRSDEDEVHPEASGQTGTQTQLYNAGTPPYMSPEQIHGDQNNQGPWTDLYSVGCLAYKLAAGRTPFHRKGRDQESILRAHLHSSVPVPRFRFPVPAGFARWLMRLLAKAPWDRYQRAADAARDLLALGDVLHAPFYFREQAGGDLEESKETSFDTVAPPDESPDNRTTRLEERPAHDPPPTSVDMVPALPAIPAHGAVQEVSASEAGPPISVPFPRSWAGSGAPQRPTRLVGAGLGLFGLRAIPFVGRDAERDLLWNALGRVYEDQRPCLVSIHGDAGVGKSRLAQWISQRADELGWAEVLKVTHSTFASSADGLPSMLVQALRCRGLTPDQMSQQIRHVLLALFRTVPYAQDGVEIEYLTRALTQLMEPHAELPEGSEEPPREDVIFASQEARWEVILQLVRLKASQRPVVLWLDDVQWGSEALGFVAHLLEASPPVPALVIATHRDEALRERPQEHQLLESLHRRKHTLNLVLERLSDNAQLELVLGLLGLEPTLARTVRQRTEGNPLFAVQLVGDWVDKGALVVGEQGYTLREDEASELPDDIHALWRWRLDRLVERFGEDARWTLELAAALGSAVNESTWRLACEIAAHPVPAGLRDRLLELRLALDSGDGWVFATLLLQESLERTARNAGRWAEHHRICAEALCRRDRDSPSRWSEEIARHRLAAGQEAEALPLLLEAARRHLHRAGYTRALALCELQETTLQQLGVDPGDERFRQGWLLAARVCFRYGDFDKAESLLDRAEANAPSPEVDSIGAGLLRVRARVLRMRGKLRRALKHSERAGEAFRRLGDVLSASTCEMIAARLHFESTGDHERGLALANAALQQFRDAGDEGQLAEAHYIVALLRQALGDTETAFGDTARAREIYRRTGNRFGEAVCENFLGEVARQTSAFDKAEAHYQRALQILVSIGSKWTHVQRINIALTLVQSGKYAEAEPRLQTLRTDEFEGQEAILCYIDYALMVCAASRQRWGDWDKYYEAAFAIRPDTGRVDKDLAELARIGGTLAAEQQKPGRAKRALRLSNAHWTALGVTDMVQAVDAQLAQL